LNLIVLGTGSATPSLSRNPSAQILSANNDLFLIDCGEGTQIQILKNKIKLSKLKNIFISHLHGDHYFGLIGLISSLNLAQRTEPLTIFGPKGLEQIIQLQLKYSQTWLHFKLDFQEVNTEKNIVIYENEFITVSSIPLTHRIPCCGFLFAEKPKLRNIIAELMPKEITNSELVFLKKGQNILDREGEIKYNYLQLTKEASAPKKYAYCSDTAYNESIVEIIANADLLYHEATFREDLLERAKTTFHSTSAQAAKIAKLANIKKLLIGHFSSRYNDLDEILIEAKEVFQNSEIAIENQTYEI
jgi:ribonuclease Z